MNRFTFYIYGRSDAVLPVGSFCFYSKKSSIHVLYRCFCGIQFHIPFPMAFDDNICIRCKVNFRIITVFTGKNNPTV
jgi:hypothetical protein